MKIVVHRHLDGFIEVMASSDCDAEIFLRDDRSPYQTVGLIEDRFHIAEINSVIGQATDPHLSDRFLTRLQALSSGE